jgi:hypothetical protein
MLSCSVALAQGPLPGGFGSFAGGRPGPPPNGGMHGPRPVSVVNLPLHTLSTYLGITDTQKGKIAQIREDMRGGMRPPVPGPPRQRGDMRSQMEAAEKKAAAQIKSVLTSAQNAKLATLIKTAQGLAYDNLPVEGLVKLHLTPTQMAKISTVNAKTAHSTLNSILTSTQKEVAKSYRRRVPPQGWDGRGSAPPPPPDMI